MTDDDRRLLRRAIELAGMARVHGDQPFGSLLAGSDGSILVEAQNTVVTDRDITAHPELKLARWAARELDAPTAAATTMYTSCQPCTMCQGALERSGLGRVVFALSTAQITELKGSAAPAAAPVRLDGPAMFDEARAPVDGYYT